MAPTDSGQDSLSPRTLWVRRVAVSGLVGVGTGLVAHVGMGGAMPGLMGILPALVASVLLGLVFLVRKTLLGTLLATTGSQYLFHQWASLGSAAPQLAHHHGELPVLSVAPEWATGMTLGHVMAAIVTAVFVVGHHRVVSVFRVIAELLGQLVTRRIVLSVPSLGFPKPHTVLVSHPLIRSQWRGSGVGLRAPPAFA